MIRYLLDTDTCIYIVKKKPKDVIQRFRRTRVSQVGISSITLSELVYGAAKSSRPARNRFALVQFLSPLEILSYGDAAAAQYGRLRADLENQGTPIGSLDMLIAAHALSIGCVLVTNNEKEFRRVSNLQIDNWLT